MKANTTNVSDILEQCGPLGSTEVALFFPGTPHRTIARIISDLRRREQSDVYIADWALDTGDGKRYPRPLYAVGRKTDAPKPAPLTGTEMTRRYRDKVRIPKAPNSVWQLARFV